MTTAYMGSSVAVADGTEGDDDEAIRTIARIVNDSVPLVVLCQFFDGIKEVTLREHDDDDDAKFHDIYSECSGSHSSTYQ